MPLSKALSIRSFEAHIHSLSLLCVCVHFICICTDVLLSILQKHTESNRSVNTPTETYFLIPVYVNTKLRFLIFNSIIRSHINILRKETAAKVTVLSSFNQGCCYSLVSYCSAVFSMFIFCWNLWYASTHSTHTFCSLCEYNVCGHRQLCSLC